MLLRQEPALGRWTWGLHGLVWILFHVFKWRDLPRLIPICLTLAWVCTRFKSTTPGTAMPSLIVGCRG
jgi:hypothetical protein